MSNSCFSIIGLFLYVNGIENFENQQHLIFFLPNYVEILANSVNSIVKAANIQAQYVLQEKMSKIFPDFGMEKIELLTIRDRENAIEEKVQNIISLNIGILEFISNLPQLVAQNSFRLPNNADKTYIINQIKASIERKVMLSVQQALERYSKVEEPDSPFKPIYMLPEIKFDNAMMYNRIDMKNLAQVIPDNDATKKQDYSSFINYLDSFYTKNSINIDLDNPVSSLEAQIDKFMNSTCGLDGDLSLDVRQSLLSLSSVFGNDQDKIHRLLFNFSANPNVEENSGAKRVRLQRNTERVNTIYTYCLLTLIIHFIAFEEYMGDDVENITRYYQENTTVREYRNRVIVLLHGMLEHLLFALQYRKLKNVSELDYMYPLRSNEEDFIFSDNEAQLKEIFARYSQFPLIDKRVKAEYQPVTFLLNIFQYTLNYAGFLI